MYITFSVLVLNMDLCGDITGVWVVSGCKVQTCPPLAGRGTAVEYRCRLTGMDVGISLKLYSFLLARV